MKKVISKLASMVLAMGVASTSMTCLSWFHQPKVPDGMAKFKK